MLIAAGDSAGRWIKRNLGSVWRSGAVGEVKHIQERSGDTVEGAGDARAACVQILDKAQDGGLVGEGVVD